MNRKERRSRNAKARMRTPSLQDFDPVALLTAGLERFQEGRLAEAERHYRRVLDVLPQQPDALHLLGLCLHRMGNHEGAVSAIENAVRNAPSNYNFLNNLGQIHMSAGNAADATDCYARAIKLNPRYVEAHNNLANALSQLGRTKEAVEHYRLALQYNPNFTPAHYNLGVLHARQNELSDAIACFRRTLDLVPNHVDALNNLGEVLSRIGKVEDAFACLMRALDLNSDHAHVHVNMGRLLRLVGKDPEAFEHFRRAVAIDPGLPNAQTGLAGVYSRRGDVEQAISHYRKAFEIVPEDAEVAALLYRQLAIGCVWDELERLGPILTRLTDARIKKGEPSGEFPFSHFTRCADPAANFANAKSWSDDISKRMSGVAGPFVFDGRRRKDSRITLGYLSSDFRNHATAHLIHHLFELHDRDKFQVFAYSHGVDDGSPYRKKLMADCDQFVDIRECGHSTAAQRICADQVDILIDLNGFTIRHRLEICALRPAPIQVTYLGFPGTTGAEFIDYIVTDRIVSPEDHLPYFAEKAVYMPHCYQITDNSLFVSSTTAHRSQYGLPADAFVFCSFNQSYKIEPAMFSVWMELLRNVDDSVLWLLSTDDFIDRNLRKHAEARGVDPARLVFAENIARDAHIQRLALADLALDTRIVNGHTTTSDCLHAGLPVVAFKGSHFASRVSASILCAAGLPELVADDLDSYRALALRLARNPDELRAFRSRLAANVATEPMFDTPRFVRDLERGFGQMWKLYVSGESPRHIDVAKITA